MRKIITFFSLMLCLFATAQEVTDTMYIYRNDNIVERIPVSRIDSVIFVQPSVHEAVDLGLPSGLKWATCNVGANSPEDYGSYYAWGETEEKEKYDWTTYKWCKGNSFTLTKYCTDNYYGTVDNKTVLDTADDVAHVKWGGNWRMPTADEYQELIDRCDWAWTTLNGVRGYRVTGMNGNSIFLPATGYLNGTQVLNNGTDGVYWSSSLYSNNNGSVYRLYFNSYSRSSFYNGRYYGNTVRPVCGGTASTPVSSRTFTVNGVSFNMISVPGGTFDMGATAE